LNTVERSEQVIFRDAFLENSEFYDLKIPERYPHKSIEITLHFHADRSPDIENVRAIKIHNNGVEEIKLTPVYNSPNTGGRGVKVVIDGKPGENYRINWDFPPLPPVAAA
jgi:hypothetical protein